MPASDTAFIIGVIREKEKELLQDDEYTRIIHAPDSEKAAHALMDTAYGIHLTKDTSIFDALTAHLEETLVWLADVVQDERILQFITARYDALHIAQGLIEFREEAPTLSPISNLGSVSSSLLSDVIWHNKGIEYVPDIWNTFLADELQRVQDEEWKKSLLLLRVKKHLITSMNTLAFTDLMRDAAALMQQHGALDCAIRPDLADSTEKDVHMSFIPSDAVKNVTQMKSSVAYEQAWDAYLITLIQPYRYQPTGYDAILAYWYAKELEVKSLRSILSAKLGGLSIEVVTALKRPLYL